ncbi:MAG: ribosomal protein L7/L12 [Gemmatimonadaceae bacterium]|nr:ribosomal protein L7/L12 [Gemmatimonadaceae bacterium]
MASALPEPLPADVIAAAQRGEKIEAIKILRERTGVGLAEAKDAVEAFASGESSLGNMVSASGGSTRALQFVVVGIVLLLMGYFFLPLVR